jgi:hypothetical protein
MTVLKVEGAGSVKTEHMDNCRIRTRFKDPKGNKIYFEMSGSDNYRNMGESVGFVTHCHFVKEDKNEQNIPLETKTMPYTQTGVLDYLNNLFGTSFTQIEVTNIPVHGHNDCLC